MPYSLHGVVHGLADVQQCIEDDGVSRGFLLVPANTHASAPGSCPRPGIMPPPHGSGRTTTYFMKTSMMERHTSTRTLSFWNMSRKGRNLSWRCRRKADH